MDALFPQERTGHCSGVSQVMCSPDHARVAWIRVLLPDTRLAVLGLFAVVQDDLLSPLLAPLLGLLRLTVD